MGASMITPRPPPAMNDFGSVNMPGALPMPPPIPSAILPNRDRENSLQKRVKELEEELRLARVENEKQVSWLFFISLIRSTNVRH
jgi:hypothetical protein